MKKRIALVMAIFMVSAFLTSCAKTDNVDETENETEADVSDYSSVSAGEEEENMGNILSKNEKYTIYETYFERDGKQIYANLYIPNSAGPKYPTVILSHGYTATHAVTAPYAKTFAENGIAACVFDFCGGSISSKSDGETTEMSILTEEADLTAVMNGLSTNSAVDAENLFLMGESQGGVVSALTAASNADRVKALVLLYPAFIISEGANEKYKTVEEIPETQTVLGMKIGRIYYEDILNMNIYEEIKKYTGDVLILHGDKDTLVPISYSERAVQEYSAASLTVIKGGEHGFFGNLETEASEDALTFVSNHISK
jgi:dienelactone hydrolase